MRLNWCYYKVEIEPEREHRDVAKQNKHVQEDDDLLTMYSREIVPRANRKAGTKAIKQTDVYCRVNTFSGLLYSFSTYTRGKSSHK